jgi:chloramphenicol O-acetyltransferase
MFKIKISHHLQYMITKIGKVVSILALLTFSISNGAPLSIRLLSTNGVPLTAVALGVPFVLEVSIKDDSQNTHQKTRESTPEPTIEGLSELTVIDKHMSNSVTIINRVRSTEKKYTYVVRLDNPNKEKIKLGAALLSNTTIEPSNSIEVDVNKDQTVTDKTAGPFEADPRYELILDKKEPFVREKVSFILRFTYAQEGVKLEAIQELEADHIRVGTLSKPQGSNQVRNGIPYTIVEMHGSFYPEQQGQLVIPGLRAEYTVSKRDQTRSWFDGFFGPSLERKHLYSNGIVLPVRPLPQTNKRVDAIGNFTQCTLSLDHTTAAQGDGVVVTLKVTGEGDLEHLKAPPLQVPEQIRYYASKHTLKDDTKEFDYILQGLEVGIWKIPAQEFTYFNPEQAEYKTVKTEPVLLTIEPSTTLVPVEQGEKNLLVSKLDTLHRQVLNYQQKAHGDTFRLSTMLFIMLATIPMVWLTILSVYRARQQLVYKKEAQRSLSNGRKKIKEAAKKDDPSLLYSIMKTALIKRLGLTPELTTDELLLRSLRLAGLETCLLEEWELFMHKLLTYTGYAPDQTKRDSLIFEQALAWINRLELQCKVRQENTIPLSIIFLICSIIPAVMADRENREALHDIVMLRRVQSQGNGAVIGEIDNLIAAIKNTLGVAKDQSQKSLYDELYLKSTLVPDIVWQFLFLVLWWSLIFFGNLMGIRYKYLTLGLLMVVVACGGITAYGRSVRRALVKEQAVALRVGPDISYPLKAQLTYLDDITIIKDNKHWYYVSSGKGKGWIASEDIELI